MHYVLTDKINSSIRIRRILKVRIRIRRMRILTSFVTSLVVGFVFALVQVDSLPVHQCMKTLARLSHPVDKQYNMILMKARR